ncbi:hypothetical protein SSUA7_1788 [Streptococcus suis A7]|uniref:Uncharacterized protein n=1 Tax=Streptococcus suis (strain GZ1) TaxID=423211 RepID=D5AK73_STRGZ|nr:hypothetical protein SSGZ1_1782 [Streptococcus suis GZ1]ADV70977.1 hypothetical protein SSUJS14_1926 [Streptococcus suis JS14]AER16079.1 hypothetical protein SSU12_1904 [Streptococcus suis SS12]AER45105.1 hypothetical protein SSUA7_1788 [Streptococcus suis A7]
MPLYKVRQSEFKQTSGLFEAGNPETEFLLRRSKKSQQKDYISALPFCSFTKTPN